MAWPTIRNAGDLGRDVYWAWGWVLFGTPVWTSGGRSGVGAQSREKLDQIGSGIGIGAALILTRAVPVFSEAATVIAGAAKMPFIWFIKICGAANFRIAATYGLLGSLAQSGSAFLLIFTASLFVPSLAYILLRIRVALQN